MDNTDTNHAKPNGDFVNVIQDSEVQSPITTAVLFQLRLRTPQRGLNGEHQMEKLHCMHNANTLSTETVCHIISSTLSIACVFSIGSPPSLALCSLWLLLLMINLPYLILSESLVSVSPWNKLNFLYLCPGVCFASSRSL